MFGSSSSGCERLMFLLEVCSYPGYPLEPVGEEKAID